MNIRIFTALLCLVPGLSFAVSRADSGRVGVNSMTPVASRMPTLSAYVNGNKSVDVSDNEASGSDDGGSSSVSGGGTDCRDAYRACMDEFCLLDEADGYRCTCSNNIELFDKLIKEIKAIQQEADELYTVGVERERLGAKVDLVFTNSGKSEEGDASVTEEFVDDLRGDALYVTAAEFCASELKACGAKAKMEEVLYSRQITADCKAFGAYLDEQKINAQANKSTAEAAVRQATLEMLDTTNKYNRGECLLAYKTCVADKGGCGANFENCLSADLLDRRANACDNVLDQCMAVRKQVEEDWMAEAKYILTEAQAYADKYKTQTCLAQIQVCLEDNCSTATNSACLSDIKVAAGICPIINECNEKVSGLQDVIKSQLGEVRTRFCQNDVDACLREKCGANFEAPECIGKSAQKIAEYCPRSMFASCKNETHYDLIVSSILLQMDYKLTQGCINHFSEQLGKVCGTDMACLPNDSTVESLVNVPESKQEKEALRDTVRANAATAVDNFFAQFETDTTVAACKSYNDSATLQNDVFVTAKMIAKTSAEARALRALETKIAELSRQQDVKKAEKNCYTMYQVETPNAADKNSSYIRSVAFEPALRNCHVCRVQRVCEVGGESKGAAAMKAAAGGLSTGASVGTMIAPGWGTAIGTAIGAVGAGIGGYMLSDGEKEFCQEIESCEDINM